MTVKWQLSLKGTPDYNATVTLGVSGKETRGKPVVTSENKNFQGALAARLQVPIDMDGHLLDGEDLLPWQVQHNIQLFNNLNIYEIRVLSGAEFIEYPDRGNLPKGAIP